MSRRSLWQCGLKCIAVSVWLGPGAPSVATSNIRPCVMVKVPRPLHSSSLIDTLPDVSPYPLLINLCTIHCIHSLDRLLFIAPFSTLSLGALFHFFQLIVCKFSKGYSHLYFWCVSGYIIFLQHWNQLLYKHIKFTNIIFFSWDIHITA